MIEKYYFLVYEAAGRILEDSGFSSFRVWQRNWKSRDPFRSTPFRFRSLNLVTILWRFTFRKRSQRNAIFRVYIWEVVRFLSFRQMEEVRESRKKKKKFFLPLPCVRYICRFLSFFFFSFISFFETRVFLWNLFVPCFFEITFCTQIVRKYENISMLRDIKEYRNKK